MDSRVTSNIKFVGTSLYIWVVRGTVESEVSCPRTQHNAPNQGLNLDRLTRVEHTNHKATSSTLHNIAAPLEFVFKIEYFRRIVLKFEQQV